MKKSIFKKSLSVFLSLLMVLGYFGAFSVFMPITAEALPATVNTYVTTDAYGTPKWDANADRWFKWSYNSDYVKVHYPSNIYLDVTETLQSAGYYFNVEWHFGDSSNYRVLLGAPIWGDYTAYSGYPSAYYTMTNIFSDYKVDAELPTNAPAGLYGKTNSSTDYDLRIVGYGWDGQGSDGFTFNNVRHDKYVLWRNNVNRTDPMYTKIFLMGTPSSSASGKTQQFNTSGGDIASFGLLQQYGSSWGNADSRHMFNKKGTGGQSTQSAVDCSNYTEYSNGTYWPEMAWNVTVYDKSSLKNEINKAADLINRFAGSKDKIVAGNWDTFLSENSQAENQIIIRAQTQSNINTAKNELYNAAYALYIGADKSELTTAINQANAIRNAADYTAKYSEASRQALDNAVNAALAASVYANTPSYHLYTNNDAANLVAADQNEIARLTSDINLAKANLVGSLYELTFKFANGTSTVKSVWQGNEVIAPDNSTKAPDSLYHYTYTWSPAIVSPPTGNATYTETLSYEGHNFGGWTVTMDATCTATGAKQRSCITCGYIETDVVEKLEHTPMAPVEKDRVEPDCITDGSYTKEIRCEECGNMISSETVTLKATGHTFNETVNANEATCTADGNLAYKTCSVCNLYFAGDAAVNSVDGKTTNADFILTASGHALVHFAANEAKCGVAGNIEYWQCGNCDCYYLDEAATMPTTATAVVLPALEHSYNAVKHEATCTNGEYYTYTCANCGDTKTSEEGEPLEHPYVFVKNDPAPTCTTGGTAHYECEVCGATKTEPVAELGHSAVFVPFEDSTCTETGVKAHWFCAQCNTAFEDEDCTVVLDSIVVELKDHSWSDWNETLAPTCSATGLEVRECSVCHETEEQPKAIDPNAHKWNAYEDLGNGKHTRTCEYDAENHQQVVSCTYGEWMTTTQPDCLTAGEQTKTCQFCTGTATQPVAALGHTFGETVAANEATCTAKGNEAYKQCQTCSLYFAADAATDAADGKADASAFDIAMLEHTYATETNRVPSTCKTAGSVTTACGCGATETTALALDADNHEKLVKLEAKAATCSATGLTEGEKCEACGVVTVAQTATEKLAHTEATREENKVPATCGKDGSYTLVTYCSVCDEVLKEEAKVIPATGEHVYATEIDRVPSTCKTAGSVTMACGCGATETTALELDANNHEKLVKLEAKAATCSATGLTEGEKCEACGVVTVAQTETAKLAHTEATREENKVPATCGKDGSYTLVTYCSVCDEVLKEEAKVIPATGEHVYATEIDRVPSTCKTAGSVTMACGCGATETTALELDADKHEKLVKLEAKAATCSATGLTEGEKCEACGVVTVAQTEIAKLAHTEATREENIVPATCGKDGSYTLVTYCSVCDEVLKEEAKVIPATGEHVYATEIGRVPSTCKTAGSVTMACGCGATETTTLALDADNHEKLVKLEAVAATCSATGLTEGEKCEACGVVTVAQTETAKLAHTEATREENKVEATCGKDGSYTLVTYCSVCDEVLKEEAKTIPATGEHVYATEIGRVDSTCKTAGSVTMACGCGAEQTTALELDENNHEKLVKLEAVAATCSATGLTEGEKCEACGVVTVAQTETAKLAHTEATREENKVPATCGKDGSYTLVTYCSVCNEVLKEEAKTIPATGEHVYATEIGRVPSTCKTAGSVTMACGCGATETTALELDADNHEKLVKLEAKAATCSATGLTEGEKCEACGVVTVAQTETAKLAHTEATREENKVPATCGKDGSYTLVTYCSVCDEVLKEEAKTIPATGEHVYATEIDRVPSTCKTAGSVTMACGCGAEQTTALELDENNHEKLVKLEAVAATCSATGLTEGEKCEACGVVTVAQTETAKLAHTEATREENKVPATCGKDGSYTLVTYCSVCDEVLKEEEKTIAATGEHVYATEIGRVPSTCKTAGSVTMACGCGATETTALELDSDNHEKLVKLEAVAATCSATGLTEGEKCEACGVVTVAQTETAKLAHTEATREENKVPATCGKDGSYTLVTYCSVCDEVLKEEAKTIPALEHEWKQGSLIRPTQKADGTWGNGVLTYVCIHNNAHTKTEIVNRADYAEYDEIIAKLEEALADPALSDAARAEIEGILDSHGVAGNLIESEQNLVDSAVANMASLAEKYIAEFKVVFVGADGSVLSEQTVKYGCDATAPEAPAVAGFVFVGWDKDFTNVKSDLTVTALYEEGSTHIALDAAYIKVAVKESKQIKAEVLSDEDIDTTLTWSIADPTVASIDENGVVTGKRSGKTTVTVTAANGLLSKTVDVYVYAPNAEYMVELLGSPYGSFVVGDRVFDGFTYVKVDSGAEFRFRFAVNAQINSEVLVVTVNGKELTVDEDNYFTVPCVYDDLKITVTAIETEEPDADHPATDGDTCLCHSQNALFKFIWKILIFFCKLFGVENYHYCECGKAHW